jgi:regulatory protein
MRLESVAAQPDRAGRYTVRFEDGSVLRLYKQTVQDFGLYPGMDMSDEELRKLQNAASAMSAKMRAVRIVAASNVSKKDLEQRLVHKGEDPQQAKKAVQWMEDMQLVDDRRTAEQVVQKCIHKGYGLARAKQALYEKKIPKEYWDEVLAEYPDQTDSIAQYIRNRLGDSKDPAQVRKVVDALIRRGHSCGQIRNALNRIDLDTEEFPEG